MNQTPDLSMGLCGHGFNDCVSGECVKPNGYDRALAKRFKSALQDIVKVKEDFGRGYSPYDRNTKMRKIAKDALSFQAGVEHEKK